MRQSTALHATRRNQVSAVVRQAKHYCVDRDADLHDVVADPPRLPGWERVVGDGRHLPEERPAVLDQPVSNPLAFPGSPHATLRFPKLLVAGAKPRRVLPRAGAITSRFESLEKLWRRRDERTSFGPSRRDSNPCFSLERASPWLVISPTSTPGATARCHSRPQSARRTSLLIEDWSWRSQAPSRGLSQKRPGAVPRQTNNERPLGVPAGV